MTDRLTDTELDAIRDRLAAACKRAAMEAIDVAALLAEVSRLRAERAEIEYGIVRPSQTPSMSGLPLWVQIVSATFSTRKQAELALRNVPSLREKEYAARIVSRRAPGSWCPVEDGDDQ